MLRRPQRTHLADLSRFGNSSDRPRLGGFARSSNITELAAIQLPKRSASLRTPAPLARLVCVCYPTTPPGHVMVIKLWSVSCRASSAIAVRYVCTRKCKVRSPGRCVCAVHFTFTCDVEGSIGFSGWWCNFENSALTFEVDECFILRWFCMHRLNFLSNSVYSGKFRTWNWRDWNF